jgi:hypothetical protein
MEMLRTLFELGAEPNGRVYWVSALFLVCLSSEKYTLQGDVPVDFFCARRAIGSLKRATYLSGRVSHFSNNHHKYNEMYSKKDLANQRVACDSLEEMIAQAERRLGPPPTISVPVPFENKAIGKRNNARRKPSPAMLDAVLHLDVPRVRALLAQGDSVDLLVDPALNWSRESSVKKNPKWSPVYALLMRHAPLAKNYLWPCLSADDTTRENFLRFLFLECGADPQQVCFAFGKVAKTNPRFLWNDQKMTPLHACIFLGDYRMAHILVHECGALTKNVKVTDAGKVVAEGLDFKAIAGRAVNWWTAELKKNFGKEASHGKEVFIRRAQIRRDYIFTDAELIERLDWIYKMLANKNDPNGVIRFPEVLDLEGSLEAAHKAGRGEVKTEEEQIVSKGLAEDRLKETEEQARKERLRLGLGEDEQIPSRSMTCSKFHRHTWKCFLLQDGIVIRADQYCRKNHRQHSLNCYPEVWECPESDEKLASERLRLGLRKDKPIPKPCIKFHQHLPSCIVEQNGILTRFDAMCKQRHQHTLSCYPPVYDIALLELENQVQAQEPSTISPTFRQQGGGAMSHGQFGAVQQQQQRPMAAQQQQPAPPPRQPPGNQLSAPPFHQQQGAHAPPPYQQSSVPYQQQVAHAPPSYAGNRSSVPYQQQMAYAPSPSYQQSSAPYQQQMAHAPPPPYQQSSVPYQQQMAHAPPPYQQSQPVTHALPSSYTYTGQQQQQQQQQPPVVKQRGGGSQPLRKIGSHRK